MICGFPDYYHYTKNNCGAGYWSLMDAGNLLDGRRSPCGIDAYTRLHAGWATPMALSGDEGWISINDSRDNIYQFTNPTNSGEYFLIENRQQRGCDRALLHGGIQIWRCREGTNNMHASQVRGKLWSAYADLTTPASRACCRWSGELYMEQADGWYELEDGSNGGETDV